MGIDASVSAGKEGRSATTARIRASQTGPLQMIHLPPSISANRFPPCGNSNTECIMRAALGRLHRRIGVFWASNPKGGGHKRPSRTQVSRGIPADSSPLHLERFAALVSSAIFVRPTGQWPLHSNPCHGHSFADDRHSFFEIQWLCENRVPQVRVLQPMRGRRTARQAYW